MRLHNNPSEFKEAILTTAQRMRISDVFVEKDYWVTLVLYRLSLHPELKRIVFKGGTSLSKAYGLIERFSEDIDLAVTDIDDLNGNQIKTLIGKISKHLTTLPFEDTTEERTSKGSKFRRTVHRYPRLDLSGEFESASPDLLLEINSFTKPTPILKKRVRSYVGDFLFQVSPKDLVTYDLDFFEIQVLGIERTYIEKLLSLIRHSYEGAHKVREKIRHLYDIAKLESCLEIQALKSSPSMLSEMVAIVKDTDRTSSEFAGDWLESPFSSAPLFTSSEIRNAMHAAYRSSSFKSLIWNQDKMPSFDKAWNKLMELSKLL